MIDLGIVNDLSNNKQPAIFEDLARRIREIDRALDAVTKTELLRKAYSGVADGNDSAGATNFFDNIAAIMRLDLFLHRRHHVWRTQVNFLARGCSAGNQIRAHTGIRQTLPSFTLA